jgi:hypothetical protein
MCFAIVHNIYLVVKLNEALAQHPELLKVLPMTALTQPLDAVYKNGIKMFGVLADALLRLACGFEGS